MALDQWGAANTRCIVDPPCVLQFACDPVSKDWDLGLVDLDIKCKYYEQVKDKVSTNCICSTENLSQNEDGSWNLAFGCPEPQTNSAATLYSIWSLFVLAVILILQ
jgi:hypothetical protein